MKLGTSFNFCCYLSSSQARLRWLQLGQLLSVLTLGLVLVIAGVNWHKARQKNGALTTGEHKGLDVLLIIFSALVLPLSFRDAGAIGALATSVIGGVIFYLAGVRDLRRG